MTYAQGDGFITEEMPPTLTGEQLPPRWRPIRRWKVRRAWARRPSYMADLGDRGIDRKTPSESLMRMFGRRPIPRDEWGRR